MTNEIVPRTMSTESQFWSEPPSPSWLAEYWWWAVQIVVAVLIAGALVQQLVLIFRRNQSLASIKCAVWRQVVLSAGLLAFLVGLVATMNGLFVMLESVIVGLGRDLALMSLALHQSLVPSLYGLLLLVSGCLGNAVCRCIELVRQGKSQDASGESAPQ